MINIGKRIREELYRQERSVSWLARKLNRNRAAIYRVMCKNSIDTTLLMTISKVLDHDFFSEFSAEMTKQQEQ